MELLALCRACFIADEIWSAGEAFLSRKGLAWSRPVTIVETTVLPQEPGLHMSQAPPYSQSWDGVSLAHP